MTELTEGIIYKGTGGLYTVKTADGFVECRARGVFKKDNIILKSGDRVRIKNDAVWELLPRRNTLVRPAVSNIDKLIIVVALADPDPSPFSIDKLTVVAEYYGIKPVIVFNKADISENTGLVDIYSSLGYSTYVVSAKNGTNVDAVRAEIKDCVCVVSGVSGAGKSTLLNALSPELGLETGDISKKLQRGKHTTRTVEFFDVFGGTIADTPGFSSLSVAMYGIQNRAELSGCFPEFKNTGLCRFRDCSHTKEDGCSVIESVCDGTISRSRHESYVRLYEELGEYKFWEHKEEESEEDI